jgi:hypothetical protein
MGDVILWRENSHADVGCKAVACGALLAPVHHHMGSLCYKSYSTDRLAACVYSTIWLLCIGVDWGLEWANAVGYVSDQQPSVCRGRSRTTVQHVVSKALGCRWCQATH